MEITLLYTDLDYTVALHLLIKTFIKPESLHQLPKMSQTKQKNILHPTRPVNSEEHTEGI